MIWAMPAANRSTRRHNRHGSLEVTQMSIDSMQSYATASVVAIGSVASSQEQPTVISQPR